MRKGVGVSRILNAQDDRERWNVLANSLSKDSLKTYNDIADKFRMGLRNFLEKYRKVINADPSFRLEFLEMCDLLGIDPLLQCPNSVSRMLGLSSFYSEVTVRILDVCLHTRAMNGGLCEMTQMLAAFPEHVRITEYDIIRCINGCSAFGQNSIRTLFINDKTIIVTSPLCMGNEHHQLLEIAASLERGITIKDVTETLGWSEQKALNLLNYFIQQQIVWIDKPNDDTYYWFPCFFNTEHLQV